MILTKDQDFYCRLDNAITDTIAHLKEIQTKLGEEYLSESLAGEENNNSGEPE